MVIYKTYLRINLLVLLFLCRATLAGRSEWSIANVLIQYTFSIMYKVQISVLWHA